MKIENWILRIRNWIFCVAALINRIEGDWIMSNSPFSLIGENVEKSFHVKPLNNRCGKFHGLREMHYD